MTAEKKKEDPVRDRFVKFLRREQGIEYKTKAEDVKNRYGNKDFDYLLCCASGRTLALEITSLIESNQAFAKKSHRDLVISELRKYIDRKDIPGRYLVLAPYTFSVSKPRLFKIAQIVAQQIFEAASTLKVDRESRDIRTDLGRFKITRESHNPKGIFFHYGGYSLLDPDDVKRVREPLQSIITAKNQQLDSDADRRILLIVKTDGFADEQSVRSALSIINVEEFGNIDEIFMEIGTNNFIKVYER